MIVKREAIIIKLAIKSSKRDVEDFLCDLRMILENDSFRADTDFILIRKAKKDEDQQFSTPYTLLDLEYDTADVIEKLKELTVYEYSETLIDKDNSEPPLLFVFGKDINGRQIYIKLKIKNMDLRKILCVSFHYAKEKMIFPYA